MIEIQIQKMFPDAILPTKKYNDPNGFHDLGWDLYAYEDCYIYENTVGMVRTGLRISLPNDYGMVIKDRSSGSQKYEVVGGVYDPSYRGEICVNIHNYKDHQVMIKKGEKFAQMVVIPNLYTVIKEVDIISIDTPRGEGCLGSTDK